MAKTIGTGATRRAGKVPRGTNMKRFRDLPKAQSFVFEQIAINNDAGIIERCTRCKRLKRHHK